MATKKKIAIGSCVRQEPLVLEYHLKSLKNLTIPKDVEISYLFVDDSDQSENSKIILDILPEAKFLPSDPRPVEAKYGIGTITHQWSEATFDHLAKQKQKLLDWIIDNNYDYLFLVDSDLLLDHSTLLSAYSTRKNLVSSVFWTEWSKNQPKSLGPQVWLRNPYSQEGFGMTQGEFWKRLADRRLTRVFGGGACHLIHKSALEKGVRYYPRLPGLPNEGMWQGEDRTFAILCQQLHQHQFADPWPDIFHAYHRDQRTDEVLQERFSRLTAPKQLYAKHGDLINFTVESLEDSRLKESIFSIRGRLGGLELVPNLEAILLNMLIGESELHEVSFPFWWPELAGETRILRITLLDAKPYGFQPILENFALGDVE